VNPTTAELITLGQLREALERIEAQTHSVDAKNALALAEALAVQMLDAEKSHRDSSPL